MKPFSKKSWHSTIYRLTYGYDVNLPTNLCPYFWGLLLSLVLSFTVGLFLLPFYLGDRLFKEDSYKEGYFRNANIGKAIVLYLFVAELYTMIALFFVGFDFNRPEVGFGLSGWLIVMIVGVVFLVKWYNERKPKVPYVYKPQKEKEPSIVAEFIKAKYNKYCPKITWRD